MLQATDKDVIKWTGHKEGVLFIASFLCKEKALFRKNDTNTTKIDVIWTLNKQEWTCGSLLGLLLELPELPLNINDFQFIL